MGRRHAGLVALLEDSLDVTSFIVSGVVVSRALIRVGLGYLSLLCLLEIFETMYN